MSVHLVGGELVGFIGNGAWNNGIGVMDGKLRHRYLERPHLDKPR